MPKLSLSEVRRRLPELVRGASQGRTIEITNRGAVVARLVGPANDAASTADILVALRPKPARSKRRPRIDVSTRKTDYLTGRAR